MGSSTVAVLLDGTVAPGLVYAAIIVLLALDAFVPVVPTQALMIGGGILAASGEVRLAAVVAAGALGAFVGDQACFQIGRVLAAREARAALTGRAPVRPSRSRLAGRLGRAVRERMSDGLRRHAFLALLACRFVPAGRMMTAVYAGRSGYPLRRFVAYELIAVTLWATYGAVLGHVGGRALISSSWVPLTLVAIVAVLFVAAGPLTSAISRYRHRTV